MSHHGCPERLSNRSKGFQEDAPSQPTMEVLVETLTGTAFEMTVSPTDTILAIKSKIFRVEGIPVSQQHILYNMKELDDSSSLRSHAITDGARLRLVLGMRVGPISTRRLPPPASVEPWRDIERLLDGNRDESEWCNSNGCRVTVVVLRDAGRINLLLRQNSDGAYCPVDTDTKYSSSLALVEQDLDAGVSESVHDNEVTMGKMIDLRRRMENLSVQKRRDRPEVKADIQKTRSEETLSASFLDEPEMKASGYRPYETFADTNFSRYDYDCSFADRYTLLPPLEWSVPPGLPPIGTRAPARPRDARGLLQRGEDGAILEECLQGEQCGLEGEPQLQAKNLAAVPAADYGPLVCGSGPGAWRGAWGAALSPARPRPAAPISHSASSLHSLHALHSLHSLHSLAAPLRPPHAPRHPPLQDAVFSSSTSDLEKLKRNSRMLPALSRARPRSQLHLSDEPDARAQLSVGCERRLRRQRDDAHSVNDSRSDLNQHGHTLADLSDQYINDFKAGFKSDFKSDFNDFKELNTIEVCRNDAEAERNVEADRLCNYDDLVKEDLKTTQSDTVQKEAGVARTQRPRCALCRKRLSIATEHRCRCGAAFCAPHRYAEAHGCAYDYRARAAALLARDNPRVAAPKLPKI